MRRVTIPRCDCGANKLIKECTCCSTQVFVCGGLCPNVEVRDGQRFVAPIRCLGCCGLGCRYTKPKCARGIAVATEGEAS